MPLSFPETRKRSRRVDTSGRFVAYRKSGPLTRINMLAQTSIRASSFADEVRVVIGQVNNESHTDKTDGRGRACVSRGAIHRLRKDGQRIVNDWSTKLVLGIVGKAWVKTLQTL